MPKNVVVFEPGDYVYTMKDGVVFLHYVDEHGLIKIVTNEEGD